MKFVDNYEWRVIKAEDVKNIKPIYGEDLDDDVDYVDRCNQIILGFLQEVV